MEDCDIHALKSSITTHLKRQAPSTLTIPKVPERLRRGEIDAYEPRIISFGPYHHGKPRLQAMEKYKWMFLEAILCFRPETPMERYIEAIKEEAAKIKTCYTDDFDPRITSVELVEMMLIDGCFLVGYLLHYGVAELDNIFVEMRDLIQYDILLLENQLPFFILLKIFELLEFAPSVFMGFAIKYINCCVSEERVNFQPPHESVYHLLHLYHSRCLYTPDSRITIHGKLSGPIHQPPSVTVLHEAGVKFEKKEVKGRSSSSSSFNLDVTFNISNGKMMIPPLVIDSFIMSKLRNLVAFEQIYPNLNELDKSFTAYVEFMDFIVNTPADVALLHKNGIIRHFLGSDKKAANFLNDLNQGFSVQSNHYLADLYKDVYEYQKKKWPKWWAMLKHNYCNSPWAVLGILAAGILLLFTLVQTFLSGFSVF